MVEQDFENEMPVIEMVDDEGNKILYVEDMIISYEDKEFAILVSLPPEECEPGCKCHEEPHVTIARLEIEDGEEVYVAPTDEEFDAVSALYEEGIDEE